MAFLALMGAVLAAQAAPSHGAGAPCRPHPIAEIKVVMRGARGLRPIVAAEINGEPAQMMLDTGAIMTFVYRTSLDRLHLNTVPMPGGVRLTSMGQPIDAEVSAAHSLVFGARFERDAPLAVEDDRDYGAWTDGLLGQPELGDADIEFDFAHGAMRLFAPDDCINQTGAYWAKPGEAVAVVELEPRSRQARPFGRITINGVSLMAMFDSGTSTSDLSAVAAAKAGVVPGGPHVVQAGQATGIGGKVQLKNWRGLFHRIDIGGEEIDDVTLDFTDKPGASADLLIGSDYFTTHRIFMSRSQGKLYATAVGQGGLAAQPKAPPP